MTNTTQVMVLPPQGRADGKFEVYIVKGGAKPEHPRPLKVRRTTVDRLLMTHRGTLH